jgi:hypothetical protein
MLKWSHANAKTENLTSVDAIKPFLANDRKVYSLDILSGWSCPFADECLSKVHLIDGKRVVKDGPNTKFRCFSASQEATYTNTYKARKHNFDLLRNAFSPFSLLNESMPKNLGVCRIHVAGDMFSQTYFDAWVQIAIRHPTRLFYAYTKSLKFWQTRRRKVRDIPNFVLTASYGGRLDQMINRNRMRSAKVVFSEAEAEDKGLEIDHDDSHAADPSKRTQSFALLIHGIQPKGSEASTALKALKGKGSYARSK